MTQIRQHGESLTFAEPGRDVHPVDDDVEQAMKRRERGAGGGLGSWADDNLDG
jgi:hypothetical protein